MDEKGMEVKNLTKQIVDLLQPHGTRTRLFALATATAASMVAMRRGDEDAVMKDVALFASLVLGLYEELAAANDTETAIKKAIEDAKAKTTQLN